ncbi:hypothetical protein C8R42DRAFT_683063 [Lentinula raphanica]|nr:hypothetical protein C8R42DRAFT_683063 [Lentinula raphanica]
MSRDEFEEWEDISDSGQTDELPSRSSSLPVISKSPRQSPRKRKSGYRSGTRPIRNVSAPIQAGTRDSRRSRDEWSTGAVDLIKFTIRYIVDVIGGGIHLLRFPLSVLLFLILFMFIMGRISSMIKTALQPLCIVPGISSSALCRNNDIPRSGNKGAPASPRWADYPGLMKAESLTFEKLLDDSVGGSGLSLDIKKAEMATADLATLVKFSKLTSKELIAESLLEFVQDARRTGRGLQRLGSKVGGAVDQIIAVNDYAANSIAAAQASPPSILYSIIPFYSTTTTEEIVLHTFVNAMGVLSSTIGRLIVEAEVQLSNLERMEERLSVLRELVAREDSSVSSAKSELLSDMWSRIRAMVGADKQVLKGYDDRLKLLKDLGEYRKQALAHVVSALQALRALSDDMEDMRERVSGPELAGFHIPVEVHLNSINLGLQRMKESRVKARQKEEETIKRVLGAEHFANL